ncbi:hypothetical protein ACGFYQ_34550 [Streptomyces sp. NPDC048258]|uniref:hypothetical protein n=1 Tax=Streptomyces sp. NPDC048258 TaxID=3365527 RepID=UPI00371B9A15
MSGVEGQGAWPLVAVLPVVAAAAVFGWAHWCYAGPSSPPTPAALAVGTVLLVAACVAYFVRVGGSGGLFGGLLLAVGMLLAVAAADQTAARGAVTTCVVGEVRTKVQDSFGEGAPSGKTVYRLVLRCPGGYPVELKDDRPIASVGEEVRVAYDPRRRVSPAVEGETSPWSAVFWAVLLLALSTVIAARRRAPEASS